MAHKATYKGSYTDRFDKRYTTLFYEYRGHEYMIEKANSWTACSSDYTMDNKNSLAAQHRRAQEEIDNMIENPRRERTPEDIAEAEEAQKKLNEAIDMMFADWEA